MRSVIHSLHSRNLLHRHTSTSSLDSSFTSSSLKPSSSGNAPQVSLPTHSSSSLPPSDAPVYAGFDPTADGLHVGHLAILMSLRHVATHHNAPPHVLLGGFTARIGDPSGRMTDRPALSREAVLSNMKSVAQDVRRVLPDATIHDNSEWLDDLSAFELLSGIGRYFRVNNMMRLESVRARMETEHGISFTEFAYSLLQAADFRELWRREGVRTQIGGSDQWGNIVAGVDLIRRSGGEMMGTTTSTTTTMTAGITVPLLTDKDGNKLGKTAGNAVWLNPDKTHSYDLFQYLLRMYDEDVPRLLPMITDLPLPRIKDILHEHEKHPEERRAQRELARAVVSMLHGAAATDAVEWGSSVVFGHDTVDDHTPTSRIDALLAALPSVPVPERDACRMSVAQLAARSGLAPSVSAARRLIRGGGLYVNNQRLSDERAMITKDHVIQDRVIMMRSGRKNYTLVDTREK